MNTNNLSFLKRLMATSIISLLLFSQTDLCAQVVIGSGERPERGALLQLKNIENITGDAANATKGMLLPRVLLTKKTELYPMLENNSDYQNNKSTIDQTHAGLVVYNTANNVNELISKGLNVWNGQEWESMQQEAEYTLDCTTVTVHGTYKENEALNPNNHYITVDITTASGSEGQLYHVTTNTVDGISFEAKGVLATGTQTITLIGTGTPVNPDSKTLTIHSNSLAAESTCSTTVPMI